MRKYCLIFILLTGCSFTKAEIGLEAAYLGLLVLDWGQTLYIADHEDYYERNPILGRHPSRGAVNSYFLMSALLHPLVSVVLPKEYRAWWQGGTIGLDALCVGNNFSIGIGMGF